MSQESISYPDIKKRVIRSFFSLISRQLFLKIIGFLTSFIILPTLLPLSTLGIYYIGISVINFFAYFSDVGLGASLIQKKQEVSEDDIKTTFTIQFILVSTISLIIILASPLIGNFYQLSNDGIWLIRVLGISFFLSSLKVVPSVLLERQLRFTPLVVTEVIETLLFNGLLILLALNKLDLWSFSFAALARGIVGTLILYIYYPVSISLKVTKASAKSLLSFGIPYQLNSFLALLKDRLIPLLIGKMVTPVQITYITWAQGLAFLPLEFMNSIIRITFPAFSRLQDDKELLGRAIEKSLFATSLVVFPALFGIVALVPAIVYHVVSSNLQPAIASFYLFAFSVFWAVISTTFTNALNAIGKINTTLKLMIMWTTLTWVLTPLLISLYGYQGVALTAFIISFTSIITIVLTKKIIAVSIIKSIQTPFISSVLMAVGLYLLSNYFVKDKITLAVSVVIGGVVYLGFIMLFDRKRVFAELRSLRNV